MVVRLGTPFKEFKDSSNVEPDLRFCETIGSNPEGWKPSEWHSSRDKSPTIKDNPSIMDSEDYLQKLRGHSIFERYNKGLILVKNFSFPSVQVTAAFTSQNELILKDTKNSTDIYEESDDDHDSFIQSIKKIRDSSVLNSAVDTIRQLSFDIVDESPTSPESKIPVDLLVPDDWQPDNLIKNHHRITSSHHLNTCSKNNFLSDSIETPLNNPPFDHCNLALDCGNLEIPILDDPQLQSSEKQCNQIDLQNFNINQERNIYLENKTVQINPLFRPLAASMAARFVSSKISSDNQTTETLRSGLYFVNSSDKFEKKPCVDENEPSKRESKWVPSSLLCKRFGVESPHSNESTVSSPETSFKRKTKLDQILSLKTIKKIIEDSPSYAVSKDAISRIDSAIKISSIDSTDDPIQNSKKINETDDLKFYDKAVPLDILRDIFLTESSCQNLSIRSQSNLTANSSSTTNEPMKDKIPPTPKQTETSKIKRNNLILDHLRDEASSTFETNRSAPVIKRMRVELDSDD